MLPESVPSLALLTAQKRSLELVVAGAPLTEVLVNLVRTVEELSGDGVVASIMLLDGSGRLRNGAAPSLPDDYLAAIDGLPADPALGTCCAAAARAQVVVTPEFATDPGWRGLHHLPNALGLLGAWSMPIFARDGSVLGTFGTYFRECREPTPVERAVVEILTRTAAIAIERDQADAAREAQTQELRTAKEAAEAADRAKSQFLAVMSHELRTPLTGIIGYADLLAEQVSGTLAPEQVAAATRIKSGAWHLVSIIDGILAFSRLEAGRERVLREPVELAELVRESVELLRPHAAAKGVSLDLQVPAEPVAIGTDPGKVRQIVLNLLGNAVKFTAHGTVTLSLVRDHADVVVRVRDSGIGIPADKLEYIFEPFAQVDQTHTRQAGGTGLGLAVSRRLARLLGGDVTAEETCQGTGSTFVLRLPGTPAMMPAPALDAEPVAALG